MWHEAVAGSGIAAGESWGPAGEFSTFASVLSPAKGDEASGCPPGFRSGEDWEGRRIPLSAAFRGALLDHHPTVAAIAKRTAAATARERRRLRVEGSATGFGRE